MLTCILSTTLVWQFPTFLLLGSKWRRSKRRDSSSWNYHYYLGYKLNNSFRSIGVSNFGVDDLATLLATAEIKPAANQVS